MIGVVLLAALAAVVWLLAMKRPGAGASAPRLAVVRTGGYPREVVGEASYQAALLKLCGGYSREGHKIETSGVLTPEPDNPHDAQAVRVSVRGQVVGYLGKDDAARFTAELGAAGHAGEAVAVDAKLVGGWRTSRHDVGHVGVYLALPWPLRLKAR